MELVDYLRLLRRRWYVLVLALLLGAGGAVAETHQATKLYAASTTFYVAGPGGRPVSTLLAQDAQARIATYAALANSGPVVRQALAAVPAGIAVNDYSVNAAGVENTIFMRLGTQASTPQGAYQLALAYTKTLPRYISQFEQSGRSGTSTTIRVLEQPTVSSTPVSPKPTKNLLVGLGIGLVVGIFALFIVEALDNRLRTSEALERLTKLPVLATIPEEYGGEALVTTTKPRSSRAEAIRQLRTNLQFATVDRTLRSVVVTSSVPDEGKTSIAADLAITFAAIGKRVILVDADLRKPSVARIMGVDGAVGLTSILIGEVQLREALIPWGREGNLRILPAGARPANPSELLASARMGEVFGQLTDAADVVVFDTPPLLPVTDGAVLGARSDGVLLVARLNATARSRLVTAVGQVHNMELPVLGVVANFAQRSPDYRYYIQAGRGGRRRNTDQLINVAPAAPDSDGPGEFDQQASAVEDGERPPEPTDPAAESAPRHPRTPLTPISPAISATDPAADESGTAVATSPSPRRGAHNGREVEDAPDDAQPSPSGGRLSRRLRRQVSQAAGRPEAK